MYPTGYGPRFVPTETQEELDMKAAIAASLLETTHSSYDYGQNTSTDHPDSDLTAALEASQLEAERQRRAAEQAQYASMSSHYHQLSSVSPLTPPSAAPTGTLSETDQVRLAELISQFEQQEAQKRLQEQQNELARYTNLATSSYHPQFQPSAAPLPYPAYTPYPSTQTPQPSYYPSVPQTLTPAENDDDDTLRQVELLSLREQQECERLREQEEAALAAVMRRSEMDDRYSTPFPVRWEVLTSRAGAHCQQPSRTTAPLPTTIQGSPTLEQAIENAKLISKIHFKEHEIRETEEKYRYLVLTYASSMHRMLAVQELRGEAYGMFGDGKDPGGAGTDQLILTVEQTQEFQRKFG